jgi:predicted nucleotidyltransferase
MRCKPLRRSEYREVIYKPERWTMLGQYRQKAIRVMETLESARLETVVHGSTARGDVGRKSDIDVFIHDPPSSFIIETALEKSGLPISARLIVQATPAYAVKAHVKIGENSSVSFPLTTMRKREREFYRFGGEATLQDLRNGSRKAGVDKRLMLIEPQPQGHRESTVAGREEEVADLLGISAETVLDRVRALSRRDEVGRTGVFLKKELPETSSFEMTLKQLASQNPAVRRRLTSLSKDSARLL